VYSKLSSEQTFRIFTLLGYRASGVVQDSKVSSSSLREEGAWKPCIGLNALDECYAGLVFIRMSVT